MRASTSIRLLFLCIGLISFSISAAAQTIDFPETPNLTITDGLLAYEADDCDYGGTIRSIRATAPDRVEFVLCEPDGAFPQKIAFVSLGIQPLEHLVATGGGGDALTRAPIGTGAYRLDSWEAGSEIVLARFEDYWGDPALEETAIFRWASDAETRLAELQEGTVDGIDNVGAGDFELIDDDRTLRLYEREGLNVMYVGMNNTIAPFDNLLVRQAIAHAINKQRIVDSYYPPGSTVANQFTPAAIFGYTSETEPLSYSPEEAQRLLEESGVELPLEVTLSIRDVVRSYLPQPQVVAEEIQAQLAEVGIDVTIDVMESGEFIDASERGELAMFLLGWSADYPDATNFLDVHFGRGASLALGDPNLDVIALLDEAGRSADSRERLALYGQVNELLRDDVPMLPIANGGSAVAFVSRIRGAHASPLSNERLSAMSDRRDDDIIFMQNGEPSGLYCADESDGEALRVCGQILEPLLNYDVGSTYVVPALATDYRVTEDAITWEFMLREAVFHDGSTFDANDVVATFVVQWDAAHPLHVGRDGSFSYWGYLFKAFLNAE